MCTLYMYVFIYICILLRIPAIYKYIYTYIHTYTMANPECNSDYCIQRWDNHHQWRHTCFSPLTFLSLCLRSSYTHAQVHTHVLHRHMCLEKQHISVQEAKLIYACMGRHACIAQAYVFRKATYQYRRHSSRTHACVDTHVLHRHMYLESNIYRYRSQSSRTHACVDTHVLYRHMYSKKQHIDIEPKQMLPLFFCEQRWYPY